LLRVLRNPTRRSPLDPHAESPTAATAAMKPSLRRSASSTGAPPRERKTLWTPMKHGAVDSPPRATNHGAILLPLACAKGVPVWAPSVLGGICARRGRGLWGGGGSDGGQTPALTPKWRSCGQWLVCKAPRTRRPG
jgi:hypothetical protein